MSKGKGFGCFGCGCGSLIAIIIVLIIGIVATVIWAKGHIYFDQPEKINKVAEEICQFKLPENLEPKIACDFDVFKLAVFAYLDNNKVAIASFIETTFKDFEVKLKTSYTDGVMMGLAKNLNINHPKNKTVTTETLKSVIMVGTNEMKVTETKIHYVEDKVTIIARQGIFTKGEKVVAVNFLATEGPETNTRATQFLNSVKL